MGTTNGSDDLFQEAARAFRDSLSPSDSKELVEFSSAYEMIQELKTRASSYQKKSKLVGFCQRLETVSESLSPFFDVIGIFIQSNPEVPALVWGAMRMVFLLASNFSSFLDKLLVMFEKIGDRLPGYAEYSTRLLNRQVSGNTDPGIPKFERTRVLKVLSYIYKDLMQFCQEACQIFGTKKRDKRWKAVAIADVFWKPFDVRFKSILERIETHQTLFLSEMQLEESKFTEYHFRKRESDSKSSDEAISRIKEQLSELQKIILKQEQNLIGRFDRISANIAAATKDREHSEHLVDLGPKRKPFIFDKIYRQIAKWINASDFSRELHKAQELRMDDTGEWFLASPPYKEFKSIETTPMEEGSEPPRMQIMLIQAKPGYGKTILSSTLIEDLAKPPETNMPGELQAPPTLPVLYYHFASDKAEECRPTHGLRACLHQIIHHNMKAGDVLDAVSIIAELDGTGQRNATDEEIRQCLLLLLNFQSSVTMVFDGLDECNDPPDLFRTVYELCCRSGAKAIFLGRPSCKPPRGCNSYTVINLDPSQNTNDLRSYLQHEIDCLNSDNLFPESSDIEEIVRILVCRAQGMFLWARLVVHYLSHEWLSPRERLDAICDDTLLNGLENLYGKIIAIIERGHPAQQEKVHRIFQVIATRRSPFTLLELRQIVAVKLGRVTRQEDLIVNFQNCLPIMCGALVECDSSGDVRFIHSSFREYIIEGKYLRDSRLAITRQSSWLTLTAICLSYLTYDIPRAVITSTVSPNSQGPMIERCFPLLRYGVARIQEYDYEIFHSSVPTSKDELERASAILQALEEWINQRLCVTAWIEANFFFQQNPTLEPLITITQMWCVRYEAHRAQFEKILSLYSRLEQDLTELRNDWASVLFNEPSAIWTSTITAFTKSYFWRTQNDTIVMHLGKQPRSALDGDSLENHDSAMILIKSQTAADKMRHAFIYVIPSSQYVTATERASHRHYTPVIHLAPKWIESVSSGWKALYQIREISSQLVLFSATVDLPTSDVSDVLMKPNDSGEDLSLLWRFSFPVSISTNLYLVLILRTLVSLRLGTATGGEKQLGTYAMCFRQLKSQTTANEPRSMAHYESIISPMRNAIAFLEHRGTNAAPARTLEIWSRMTSVPSESADQFSFRGRQSFGLKIQQTGRNILLFHPSRPCLVFTKWNEASIWWYNDNYELSRKCYTFIRMAIVPVSFWPETCLRYVGLRILGDRNSVPFALEAEVQGIITQKIIIPTLDEITKHCEGCPVCPGHRDSNNTLITRRHEGSMTIEKHGESFSATQENHTSQVVSITSTDGRTARFGHLPSLPDRVPSSVTLLSTAGSVKVVWDKELQSDYSILDTPSRHLPSIIERTLQSVPLPEQPHSERSEMSIATSSDGHSGDSQLTKKRLRTGDDTAGEEPKKHNTMRIVANITDRDNV